MAEKYQLADDFQRNLKENYGAEGENVDFAVDASRTQINKWVEEFTQHKIKDLLPEGCNLHASESLSHVNISIR